MSALHAGGKPGQPVECNRCGHKWAQDPPFEVACPTCGAEPGAYCKRPSGHQGPAVPFHAARDLLAYERGFYNHICVKPQQAKPPSSRQLAMF